MSPLVFFFISLFFFLSGLSTSHMLKIGHYRLTQIPFDRPSQQHFRTTQSRELTFALSAHLSEIPPGCVQYYRETLRCAASLVLLEQILEKSSRDYTIDCPHIYNHFESWRMLVTKQLAHTQKNRPAQYQCAYNRQPERPTPMHVLWFKMNIL